MPTSDQPLNERVARLIETMRQEMEERYERSRSEFETLLSSIPERVEGMIEDTVREASEEAAEAARTEEQGKTEAAVAAAAAAATAAAATAAASGAMRTSEEHSSLGQASESLEELRAAIAELDEADSQAELLARLVEQSTGFASRAVLLLRRDDGFRSWASLGFQGAGSALEGLEIDLPDDPAWAACAAAAHVLDGRQCAELCDVVDADLPVEGALVPIALGSDVPAVLYADRLADAPDFSLEALQILCWATARALDQLDQKRSPSLRVSPGLMRREPEPVPEPEIEEVDLEQDAHDDSDGASGALALGSTAAAGGAALAFRRPHDEERDEEESTAEAAFELPPADEASEESAAAEVLDGAADAVDQDQDESETTWSEPEADQPIELAEDEPEAMEPLDAGEAIELTEPSEPEPPLEMAPEPGEVDPDELETGIVDVLDPGHAASLDPLNPQIPTAPLAVAEEAGPGNLEPEADVDGPELTAGERQAGFTVEPLARDPRETVRMQPGEAAALVESAATTVIPSGEVEPPPPPIDIMANTPVEPPAASPAIAEPAPPPPDALATRVITADDTEAASALASPPPPPPEPAQAAEGNQVEPPPDVVGPGSAFRTDAAAGEAMHDEARRLARLLVSEIKLYNQEQVDTARRAGNIYAQLREYIDRSRETYEERIDPRVLEGTDYFREELVRTLAGGDERILGL